MQPSLPPSHPFFLPLVVSSKIKSQHQEIGARNCAAHTTTKNPLQGNPDFTISHFTSPSTGKSQWKSPTERGISLSLSLPRRSGRQRTLYTHVSKAATHLRWRWRGVDLNSAYEAVIRSKVCHALLAVHLRGSRVKRDEDEEADEEEGERKRTGG